MICSTEEDEWRAYINAMPFYRTDTSSFRVSVQESHSSCTLENHFKYTLMSQLPVCLSFYSSKSKITHSQRSRLHHDQSQEVVPDQPEAQVWTEQRADKVRLFPRRVVRWGGQCRDRVREGSYNKHDVMKLRSMIGNGVGLKIIALKKEACLLIVLFIFCCQNQKIILWS